MSQNVLVTRSSSTTSVSSVTIRAATDESDALAIGSTTVVQEHVHFEEEVLSDMDDANQKKWYHTPLPVNWIQKLSSEYHFGNYVITSRETGTKVWEDMPIYARIGMHLLFAGMFDRKVAKAHKIQHLFSVESVNQGRNFDAPESVSQIQHFIKTYKLDLSELLEPDVSKYRNFNEFFYRKLRPDARPIHDKTNPNIVVSSADCRLCVFESISSATRVWIKGKSFSLPNLLRDPLLASQFQGGSIALFRLAPQDYHRFHSPVSGVVMEEARGIGGGYVTVNPMAVNNDDVDVFTENVRKVSVIRMDDVVKCVFVSIGALLVGSIQLTGAKCAGTRLEKGDELGYFAYGGSTCILLFQAGAVRFDEDLVATSLKGLETLVRMGERIGERIVY
ncbi:MAG: phosphatidylserine decarboxylase-domain-containing protein [Linnemannia gamsii]|nr:MAG: phosphatidylserine decarboxylase-domain-containing protein [Linnemannia gamsii]